jgi:hypothetical protein
MQDAKGTSEAAVGGDRALERRRERSSLCRGASGCLALAGSASSVVVERGRGV